MKYCSHCGEEIMDEAVICPHCGCSVEKEKVKAETTTNSKETIRMIAKVFMIIGCVTVGWFIIPLIWMIPMTITYWKACDEGKDVSVAFKICSLLFVNMIAGILMLCDSVED